MIPAKGCVKNYHWGTIGDSSHIAEFQAVATNRGNTLIDQYGTSSPKDNDQNNNCNSGQPTPLHQQPLAELWFGSHPSGPSTLVISGQTVKLNEFLANEPDMVGVVDHYFKFNKQLPFLFKILSVGQPLSLQAHPDKKLAEKLHKKDPKNYPDSNHKPELAIALTDFEVLCDFRPHREIVHYMKIFAPLQRVVGEENYQKYQKCLKSDNQQDLDHQQHQKQLQAALGECFKSLMVKDSNTMNTEISLLLKHDEHLTSDGCVFARDLLGLVGHLKDLYPGDPGVFAPFFLNYFKLAPGQAVYLKANKLHAYLRGECIECMACSDNVVRAGLTSKFRDVQTLVGMLDYEAVSQRQDLILTPEQQHQHQGLVALTTFAPTEEFKVQKIVFQAKDCGEASCIDEYTLPCVLSGSFIIILEGRATAWDFFDLKIEHKLKYGSAAFIPPKIALKLTNIKGPLVMYRAFC